MSEPPNPADGGGDVGLDALLALLNGAADSFRTVEVTYRDWRHEQRLREAFRAYFEEQKRRGAATSTVTFAAVRAARSGDPGPVETEEAVRIWCQDQRLRHEHRGGRQDGPYSTVDGRRRWRSWIAPVGNMSNGGAPSISGGIDRRFEVMLNPAPLLAPLRFHVAGDSQIAGRATITTYATPTGEDPKRGRLPRDLHAFHALHSLGIGADSYQLEVDRQRGVLLAATAIRDGQPFYAITTLAISFDEPILAAFSEGEQIQPLLGDFFRPRHITPAEAQCCATFTVLVPDRVPADWQVHCVFVEASQLPPFPAHVALFYRSSDGQRSVSISQTAATDAAGCYGNVLDDESWYAVVRDGTSIKISPSDEWLPGQAHLTRYGTFAYLRWQGLTADELAAIAVSLRPASEPGPA
jgi:hypothetical protein